MSDGAIFGFFFALNGDSELTCVFFGTLEVESGSVIVIVSLSVILFNFGEFAEHFFDVAVLVGFLRDKTVFVEFLMINVANAVHYVVVITGCTVEHRKAVFGKHKRFEVLGVVAARSVFNRRHRSVLQIVSVNRSVAVGCIVQQVIGNQHIGSGLFLSGFTYFDCVAVAVERQNRPVVGVDEVHNHFFVFDKECLVRRSSAF